MTFYNPNFPRTANLGWLLNSFEPITLDGLNEKAEMLSRIDNKYVVRTPALRKVMAEISGQFEILDINSCRAFHYVTRYFDDPQRSAYYEHHQGLRKGFKVRVRRYADAGLCFLEVKVKGKRGRTVKHRLPYDPKDLGNLTPEAIQFAKDTYGNHYDKPFDYNLKPALNLQYKRVTLVSKSGGERLTIDTGMQFSLNGKWIDIDDDIFIVETKSRLGRGQADVSFREAKNRPTKRCSKYCIGMAALGEVVKWNRFIPTMRKLSLIDGLTMKQFQLDEIAA